MRHGRLLRWSDDDGRRDAACLQGLVRGDKKVSSADDGAVMLFRQLLETTTRRRNGERLHQRRTRRSAAGK